MTWINCFCIVLCFLAIAYGGFIPDEKLLDEETLAEYQRSFPYGFGLSSAGSPTYETAYDLSPPRLPPLKSVTDSRTRYRERNPARSSGRTSSSSSSSNDNRDPTDTNELTNGDKDLLDLLFRADNNDKRVAFLRDQQRLEDVRNFYNVGEIRKKREANPDPTGNKPRWKRTHCKRCGGGGYGGGGGHGGYPAVPLYAVAVPVYGGHGGLGGHGGGGGHIHKPQYGGGGCNTCGGSPGLGGGFGGGGYGGSFSHSSSQSSSSSGSWGYGKK